MKDSFTARCREMSKGISTLVESGYKAKNFAALRFDMNDWRSGHAFRHGAHDPANISRGARSLGTSKPFELRLAMTISRAGELRKIRAYVRKAEASIAGLGIVPRVAHKYPFDIVALAMLSKAFALSKACLKLLTSDHPDEAYGLVRSLVECGANLRYLTSDPAEQERRTRAFVKYAMADKAYWYHYALEIAKGEKKRAELRAYAKQYGISPNTKLARQHWSGKGSGFVWDVTLADHPLDGPVTEKHRRIAHAADYHQTSGFVHCGLQAIDCYYVDDGVPFKVSRSSGHHETHQSALFIILIYIHSSIGYVLYGLNLERPGELNAFFQRTLDKMEPVPTKHS